jgi:hypothetical protein
MTNKDPYNPPHKPNKPDPPINCGKFKMGKQDPERLLATVSIGDYLTTAKTWPAVKPRGWEYAVPASKMDCLGNDMIGLCVVAAMMHHAQAETANTSNPLTPTRQLTIETYTAITGYDPKNPDTDQGTTYAAALSYWKKHGIPMLDAKGHEVITKIIGWASLDLSSIVQQRYACDLFGGTVLGIQCPQSAEEDTTNWTIHSKSPILGGHAVNMVGQGSVGCHLGSWGMWIPTQWSFARKYADENYAVVSSTWVDSQTSKSPSGLDLNGLLAAMKGLK